MLTRELRVLYFCEYHTERGAQRQQDDWDALWFVRACKGEVAAFERLAQPIRLSLRGHRCVLDAPNVDAVIAWFGDLVAETCRKFAASISPVAFVPVPSSGAAVGASTAGRTAAFADAVAHRWPEEAYTLDVLRWTGPMQKAHAGGTRDPRSLYKNLSIIEPVRPNERVVLIDDVLTTGGHLSACAAALWNAGADVQFAVAAAHTVLTRSRGPAFQIRAETISVPQEGFDPFS